MLKIKKQYVSNAILVLLSLAILFFSYQLLKPFVVPLLASFVVVMLVYPVYSFLNKFIRNRSLCALAVIVIFLLVVAVPIGYLINITAREAFSTYLEAKKIVVGEQLFHDCTDGLLCDFTTTVNEYLKQPEARQYLNQIGVVVNQFLFDYGSNFILKIPGRILDFFIFLFAFYYLLKDGPKIIKAIRHLVPLDVRAQDKLIERTKTSMRAVLYGQFMTAFIQGLVGALGFFMLGISSPLFWGVMMSFFSIIVIGTPFVWVPASVYLIVSGMTTGSNVLIVKGLILIVYGLLVISSIDNIIRPKLIGGHLKAHPLLVLIGTLGGLFWFGLVGIFIGPVILTLLVAVLEMYKEVAW